MEQFSAGQRNRDRHAAIHTHHAAITGSREGVGDGGESDVPAPRAIQSDSVRLHGAGDGARPAEPHPADLGYPYLTVAAVEPFDVVWFDSDLTESFMLAGLAPGRATVGAAEKVSHRLSEVPQRLLLHGLRPGCQPVVFGAHRRQLGTLLVILGCFSAWLPVLLLLYGKIPHKPGMATVLGQACRLLRARKQPKPAHINNLGRSTDNRPKGGKRRFPSPAEAEGFHRANDELKPAAFDSRAIDGGAGTGGVIDARKGLKLAQLEGDAGFSSLGRDSEER